MFYELKVIRKKTKPPIWRRVVVPSNITFAQLAVILERLLEFEFSNAYEFEFYTAKARVVEWREETEEVSDFYYSYFHAPDTYINQWMNRKGAFSFRVMLGGADLPEYRVEIEHILDEVETGVLGAPEKVNFPLIVKQVSGRADAYWSDPNVINVEMKEHFWGKTGGDEYLYSSEILERIRRGEGITYSERLVDRGIHTKLSTSLRIKELGDRMREKAKPAKRECKLDAFLKSYDKEDLLELARELGVVCSSTRRDKLAYEIARCLLDGSTMKARLLSLEEDELDAFEEIMERGSYIPTELEWEKLQAVYDLDYLVTYTNQSVQVPDEVIFLYQNLLRNGYREYHWKASWLLKCIRVACCLYGTFSLEVLYQLYRKNKAVRVEFWEFGELVKTLPEKMRGPIREDGNRRGDFYIPERLEIEGLARDDYPSYEKAYQSLRSFYYKKLGYEEDFAEYLCQLAYQTFAADGMISDYMGILNKMEFELRSEREAREYAACLMEVHNETRRPALMGHKPNEMRGSGAGFRIPEMGQVQQKTERKVYPNDPCPCGSGKKYKKCCYYSQLNRQK